MNTATAAYADHDQSLAWSDTLLLGFGPMDQDHREFVAIVDDLLRCPDADFAGHLDRFAAHAQAHFAAEDAWMEETDFPPRGCHIDEHAAVLRSVGQVQVLVAEGDIAEGRRLAQELARWFPPHVHHLDSALSHWMCKRRLGGKPVVIRRGVAVPPSGDGLETRRG